MAKGEGKKLAIGAAIAAVAGYVAGILTAPKSGKETRKDVEQTAEKGAAEVEKELKKAQAELERTLKVAQGRATKLSGKAKTELDTALGKANIAKGKAGELLTAARRGEAEDKDLQKVIDEVTDAFNSLKKYLKKV